VPTSKEVLVTGATGAQGGAVARALHAAGIPVVALVRDPESAAARALVDAGIACATGDLEDAASLDAAFVGMSAFFSVQPAPYADPDSERRQARNLLQSARRAGVRQCVHTSVSSTGWRTQYPDVDPGLLAGYWDSKEDVENMVREAGFDVVTILKPAFMMENFIAPKVAMMFPELHTGEIATHITPDTVFATVATADVGAAAAAAIVDPDRFAGAEIELAGDATTVPKIAQLISRATGRSVKARTLPAPPADQQRDMPSFADTQVWANDVGYLARPAMMRAYGLEPTSFADWAAANADALRAATTPDSSLETER
jgi:uncharacterized protein YbjT (DUF2867 family)